MKTLYLECRMGAAGDMLMAALFDLIDDKAVFLDQINSLGLPDVTVTSQQTQKCGINGWQMRVIIGGHEEHSHDDNAGHEHAPSHEHHHHDMHADEHEHEHEHHHTGLGSISALIDSLSVPDPVKADARAIYGLIAAAESAVHGRPVSEVHFHEVGALDAVADIIGTCLLIGRIAPDRIIVSPIHVGSGMVRCAHGLLPVPAPATALILKGVPIYGGEIRGELCTPTGAAILRHFADDFGPMAMQIDRIGIGMGNKDFPAANCVRAFLGRSNATAGPNDAITELSCNLDDMTGEALGFVSGKLFQAGALDVFTIPLQMKKNRPGQMLVCLCQPEAADELAVLILRHTSTFGVRRGSYQRYRLERSLSTVDTAYGPIQTKTGSGYGIRKSKAEYDDLVRAAEAAQVPLETIHRAWGIETAKSDQSTNSGKK
jgi:hypothetical protein